MDLVYGAYRKDEYGGMQKEEIPVQVSLKDLADFCLYLDKELQFKYQGYYQRKRNNQMY